MRGIGQRIKLLRVQRNMTQTDLAKVLNVASNTISTWENETREIQLDSLDALCDFFNVKLQWLMAGDLDELPPVQDDILSIPILDIKASAGFGKENFEVDPIGVFKIAKRAVRGYNGKVFNIQVAGDCMVPTLENEDWVTVFEGLIEGNGVYCLNNQGELLVKRLQFKLDGTVEVICDNKKYSTEHLKRDELIIVGKCKLRVGELL